LSETSLTIKLDTSSLKHVRRQLSTGGEVIVVDTGAILTPEIMAMIQAKHSRSSLGFDNFLSVLTEQGVADFMRDNYVGYGDKSIGDCGWATVFIEGVSMLAPKAVQDWLLYNGQESSTRYMNFSRHPFFNPLGHAEGYAIQENWRGLYNKYYQPLYDVYSREFPQKETESPQDWAKAIRAKTLDVLRGFLPAGTATNFSWTMPLRQFRDELLWLRHHPLAEIRELGIATEQALGEMFENSGFGKHYEATEEYIAEMAASYAYFTDIMPTTMCEMRVERDGIDTSSSPGGLLYWHKALALRPPKAELPKKIAEAGTMQFRFLLDFGSFRDLQRHRSVIQQMPLLETNRGLHPWYLAQIESAGLEIEPIQSILLEQEMRIAKLDTTPEIKQYYTGMGYQTANRLTGDLPALVWIAELRGTRFVHPTLRQRAIQLATQLEIRFAKHGLVLHMDPDPHTFDVHRGKHDIGRKNA
jgi:thymidylate synthase ThyX